MSKKILLADDSITIQKVISITFASEEYELITVGDGDAAIKKAKEVRPDLIMADVAMPGKTGYEVCAAVKGDTELKNTPVMLLAGTFEPLNSGEAARVKADDSIVKPFESQELLDKVKALLGKPAEAAKAATEKRGTPERPEDIWEATDFLSFTDELSEKPDLKETETPDLSFLEGDLENSTQELSLPHEDFTDLEFREEDLKTTEERKEPPQAPQASTQAPPAAVKHENASFEPLSDTFEDVVPFDFKEEELKAEPFFEEAPAKETAKPFWAETVREPEAVKEPVAPTNAGTEQELLEAAPEITAEAVEVVEPVEEARAPFKGFTEPAPAAAHAEVSDARVAEAVERAVSRAEERLRSDLEARAEGQVARAVESIAARMERSFKGDLDSRLKGAEAEILRAVEGTAARVEDRLRLDIGSRLEKSVTVPKEEIAEIVRKVAKEVIEAVAWEVIPDLAEELIKAEINRVKEAFVRPK